MQGHALTMRQFNKATSAKAGNSWIDATRLLLDDLSALREGQDLITMPDDKKPREDSLPAKADVLFAPLLLNRPERKKELLQAYYEQHHERRSYDAFKDEKKIRFFRQKIAELVRDSNSAAIDLGCRGGALTQHLQDQARWYGIDIDRHAIARANEVGIPCIEMDISSALDLKEESFDIVLITEVMEHLPHPPITIREIHRILKKKTGIMLGSVPLDYHLHRRWSVMRGRRLEGDPTHIHHFSFTELDHLLRHYFNKVDYLPLRGALARRPWLAELFGGRFREFFLRSSVRDIAWVASEPKKDVPSWEIRIHL